MKAQRAFWRIAKTKAETLDFRFDSRCAFLTHSVFRSFFNCIHCFPRPPKTDALGRALAFAYDAANRQTSATDPASDQTAIAYDAASEVTSVTDPLGNTTTMTYTPTGQLSVSTDPLGNQTVYGYDKAGELIAETLTPASSGGGGGGIGPDLSGGGDEEQEWYYNAVGQVTAFVDGLAYQTTYGYDKDGNLTSVTDPLGHQSTYGYDKAGNQTSITDPLGDQTTYGYDQVGNQTSVTDPLSNQTTYGYDGANRQTAVTDPRSGLTAYGYDLAGNLTSLTDPVGNQTTYSYNQADLLTKTTNAMGHPSTYAYDAANELTSATDADGRTITYAYDQAGRMTGETWVGGSYTATFVYNKDGMVTKAQDPFSTYTYAYNADSQVTSVDNAGTPGVPTVTLSLVYDGYQNLTSVSDSLGGSLSYGYNSDNELSSLALSLSSTLDAQVTFAYDEANRLTGITRTGAAGSETIASTLSYDNANRLTNIKDSMKLTTLANYTYGYNKASELTSYQDNSGNSLSYSYDPDGELTGATGTLLSQSYTFTYDYDKNGNRTSTSTDIGGSLSSATYSTGSGNELTNDGTYTYTYDNDGNMLTQTNLTSGSVTYYSWDYENRLTEAKEETSSGTVIYDEKYTYDVNGNRIGVSDNGTQELYTVYLGSNPYMDFNGIGTLTERYLFNPQALNVFYGQVSGSGTTEWFLTDNINSIREVVNTTGSVLDAIAYDPYGNILNQTSTTYEPRFLYAGGAYDSNTGTYLDDKREDDPADGRWLSQDPMGFGGGDLNLYRYVNNDPIVSADPSGLKWILLGIKHNNDGSSPPTIIQKGEPWKAAPAGINTAGAWGGAVEGVCIGAGTGTLVGAILGPPGMIGGCIGGGIAGGIWGYNKGKYQPGFLEGAEAAAKIDTIGAGAVGGIIGAVIGVGIARIAPILRGATPYPPSGGTTPGPLPGTKQWIRFGPKGQPPIIGEVKPPFGDGPIPPRPPGPFNPKNPFSPN